jgi:hypothetical protein
MLVSNITWSLSTSNTIEMIVLLKKLHEYFIERHTTERDVATLSRNSSIVRKLASDPNFPSIASLVPLLIISKKLSITRTVRLNFRHLYEHKMITCKYKSYYKLITSDKN